MTAKNMGRLQKVKLREAWSDEAGDFTPWLAQPENLQLLGETVGISLECEAMEKEVGRFRADILCRDRDSDGRVLIENQLESANHDHLGKLLTYTAGLKTVTMIWIAERFTDEHRAAIDWLNENTEEGIHFFALEVELWRIGDSPPAPKFNIVCKPNEWARRVADSAKKSEVSELRWRYWSEFVNRPELAPILVRPLSPTRAGNLTLPTHWRDFKLSAFVNVTNQFVGVYVRCRGENGGENYRRLLGKKEAIESTLGAKLRQEGDERQGWFTLRLSGNDVNKESDWPRQHELLAKQAVAFYTAFDPNLRELDSDGPADE